MKFRQLVIVFLLIPISFLSAQQNVELGFYSGRILPIHPSFPQVNRNSIGTDFTLWFPSGYKNSWADPLRYPSIGVSAVVQSLGNGDILGNAYGVSPIYQLIIAQGKKTRLESNLGLGLAYLDKPFSKIENEANIVNGSHLNSLGIFKLSFAYAFAKKWHAYTALHLTHYSNANFSNPNLGANVPSLGVGIRYAPHSMNNSGFPVFSLVRKSPLSWNIRLIYGLSEKGIDGNKYPAYGLSVSARRWLFDFGTIDAGMEYLFNSAPYRFMRHAGFFPGKEFRKASRVKFHLAGEIFFSRIGLYGEGGIYINDHFNRSSIFSAKIGYNLYLFKPKDRPPFNLYIGCYARAYFTVAELLEFSVGAVF